MVSVFRPAQRDSAKNNRSRQTRRSRKTQTQRSRRVDRKLQHAARQHGCQFSSFHTERKRESNGDEKAMETRKQWRRESIKHVEMKPVKMKACGDENMGMETCGYENM